MNEILINNENEINEDNKISLLTINQKLYNIFNNKIFTINKLLLKYEKTNSNHIIDSKEIKLFNFFLLYIVKTLKSRDILKLLRLNHSFYKKNKEYIHIKNSNELCNKINIILPKFLIICIFNSCEICHFLNYNSKKFTAKLFELIQIYYLNNLIDKDNLINIIRLEIISCLFK